MAEIDSILDSVKKNLGIAAEYDVFDHDIITHINSTFFTLRQLGIGPDMGYMVTDKEQKWVDFLGAKFEDYSAVKTYVFLKVKLVFDSANSTSFAISALERQALELEVRLNIFREGELWTSQNQN